MLVWMNPLKKEFIRGGFLAIDFSFASIAEST